MLAKNTNPRLSLAQTHPNWTKKAPDVFVIVPVLHNWLIRCLHDYEGVPVPNKVNSGCIPEALRNLFHL